MNRILLFAALLLLPALASGQVLVNGVDINKLDVAYCQLIGVNATILSRPRVWIDYGQIGFVEINSNRQNISEINGQAIEFNSVIDALNFFIKNGWELVSNQVTETDETQRRFIYLLRKKPV
jgi:hypothetical protein